ncbi:MAG: hypothetical protein N2749_03095 [Clostridia bacterium]|nr:hypothetical protein [Clostridia bacterium]
MLILPKGERDLFDPNYYYSRSVDISNDIRFHTGINLDPGSINISFRRLYEKYVFCRREQLKNISVQDIVIIFTGWCGHGHFSPSLSLALEFEKMGKNVMIVDLLEMASPEIAKIVCSLWLHVSRNKQDLFLSTTEHVGDECKDGLLKIFKYLNLEFFFKFVKGKRVRAISTFLFPNVLASRIRDRIEKMAVLLPDCSSVGMGINLLHDTRDMTHFVVNKDTIDDACKRYSYHKNTGFSKIGFVPNMMEHVEQRKVMSKISDVLTWFIGGGMGIGYGGREENVKFVMRNYNEGPIIIVCGDNPRWYKTVEELSKNYCGNKKIIVLQYLSIFEIHKLILGSGLVIGKPGGSTLAEFCYVSGAKCLAYPILGHEQLNAQYAEKIECATYAKDNEELREFLNHPTNTKSAEILLSPSKVIAQLLFRD